jgi:hypothetical protein
MPRFGRVLMYTTIEYDWLCGYTKPWRVEHTAIPVVNDDDERRLLCQLNMDARGLNNGWIDTMPIERTMIDVFVDTDDPRNSNPPINVDEY